MINEATFSREEQICLVKVEGGFEPALLGSLSHTLPALRAGGGASIRRLCGQTAGLTAHLTLPSAPRGSSCTPLAHVGNAARHVPRAWTRPRPRPWLALEKVSDQRFYLCFKRSHAHTPRSSWITLYLRVFVLCSCKGEGSDGREGGGPGEDRVSLSHTLQRLDKGGRRPAARLPAGSQLWALEHAFRTWASFSPQREENRAPTS